MLYYKGRLDMDYMEVIDVEDGKEKIFNMSVKNALKLQSLIGDEVHLLCAKKPEQKQRWLRAFTDERRQVQHDLETGIYMVMAYSNGIWLQIMHLYHFFEPEKS